MFVDTTTLIAAILLVSWTTFAVWLFALHMRLARMEVLLTKHPEERMQKLERAVTVVQYHLGEMAIQHRELVERAFPDTSLRAGSN